MNMRKVIYLVALLPFFLSSGCVNVDARVKEMLLKTDADSVKDNMEWVIEELEEKETDYPEDIAKIMDGGRKLSNKADVPNKFSTLFNKFVEVLVNVIKSPPKAEDKEDWVEKGMPVAETREYLSAFGIHQLGKLKGPAIGEQILSLLRKTDSEGVRAAALHAMLENIPSYTSSGESRAQALAALANAEMPAAGSQFQSVFKAVEEKIVNQDAINTVLEKNEIYNLSDKEITYILNVNERLWLHYLETGKLPGVEKLQDNVRYLSILALPRTKQFDGSVPDFSAPQLKGQQMLLAYAPGLYYFNMYDNAKLSDYSFGQLMATMRYMNSMDDFAKQAGKALVAKNKDGRKFFNHRQLLNDNVYTVNRKKAVQYVFKNLSKRVDNNNEKYREFFYAQLTDLFPKTFSVHLNKIMAKKYRDAGTDRQHVFFASNLVLNDQVQKGVKTSLKNKMYKFPLQRTVKYDKAAYDEFAKLNYPYLLKIDTPRFIKVSSSNAANAGKITGPSAYADFYITGLKSLPAASQTKYHNVLGSLLGRHDKEVSRQVSGYLKDRKPEEAIVLFEKNVVNKVAATTEHDFIMLGNLLNGRYNKLSAKQKPRVVSMYRKGISKAKKEAALRAAQEGLAFTGKRDKAAKQVAADISKRWPTLKAAVARK